MAEVLTGYALEEPFPHLIIDDPSVRMIATSMPSLDVPLINPSAVSSEFGLIPLVIGSILKSGDYYQLAFYLQQVKLH